MSEPSVLVENLSLDFRQKSRRRRRSRSHVSRALNNVSFSIREGETIGVVGKNGSGKTTLLLCLAGVLLPSSGSVSRCGKVASLIDLAPGVGRELTGREHLFVSGTLLGIPRRELTKRYREIVEFSGLNYAILDSPLYTYSAGMILRLAFSLVIHSDAQILLFDEVLAAGDLDFQGKCLAELRSGPDSTRSVVLVSHDLRMVEQVADRVLILDSGRVRFFEETNSAIGKYLDYANDSPAPDVVSAQPGFRL